MSALDGKPWVQVRSHVGGPVLVHIENAPVISERRTDLSRYVAAELDLADAKSLRDELTRRIDMIEKG